jgi:hypothetical protein
MSEAATEFSPELTTIYMLWDDRDPYRTDRVYADKESAKIALHEHYTPFWIEKHKAKIITVPVISYRAVLA